MEQLNCLCKGNSFKQIFTYDSPPQGEVLFQFNKSVPYDRKIFRCNFCGHYISMHDMNTDSFYKQDYVTSTYTNEEGLFQKFKQIISLPSSKSDNHGRVKRILDFSSNYFPSEKLYKNRPKILDVGSGLCVFLYEMKKNGWNCVALDPDERNVQHAKKNIHIESICNDFMHVNKIGKFDLISFNKVLEHVQNPIEMLSKSLDFLKEDGLVYIEVPDGEIASAHGSGREEFFIDHLHIFSATSLSLMIDKAGYKLLMMKRLQEPSSKFTLFCFISPI